MKSSLIARHWRRCDGLASEIIDLTGDGHSHGDARGAPAHHEFSLEEVGRAGVPAGVGPELPEHGPGPGRRRGPGRGVDDVAHVVKRRGRDRGDGPRECHGRKLGRPSRGPIARVDPEGPEGPARHGDPVVLQAAEDGAPDAVPEEGGVDTVEEGPDTSVLPHRRRRGRVCLRRPPHAVLHAVQRPW